MFDSIAMRYDFLNHFLSLGIDKYWRRKTVHCILKDDPLNILDLATGTADLAIAMALNSKRCQITAVDISEQMLKIAQNKINKKKLQQRIKLYNSSALSLSLEADTFDAVSIGFGIRNFYDIHKGLSEIHRVLKDKGKLYILEFSKPRNIIIKCMYNFYFSNLLPWIGKQLSGHKYAYTYLNQTAVEFPDGVTFMDILSKNGFVQLTKKSLSFGIVTLYIANKEQ